MIWKSAAEMDIGVALAKPVIMPTTLTETSRRNYL
jgi:hypothetical protein